MREIQDLLDFVPYCLLVALPIMIILSPATDAVGLEFPAHRLAQFELGGVARGPRAAALSMDARSVPSEANVNLLRKTVISRIQGMFQKFRNRWPHISPLLTLEFPSQISLVRELNETSSMNLGFLISKKYCK